MPLLHLFNPDGIPDTGIELEYRRATELDQTLPISPINSANENPYLK
jgi:hypothetical protein